MTFSSDKMTNFRPCNSKIGMVESKHTVQIEGRGDLVVNFKSSPSGTVRMNLYDVAYAPTLDYNLISVSKARRAGHNYSGVDNGMLIRVKSCLLYTSPSPRDKRQSRMPSSA